MIKWVDALFQCFRVLVDKQFHSGISSGPVAQFIHGPEFPGRIDMQQRERRRRRKKRFLRQMQHHRTVLADGKQHDRVLGTCRHFTHDVNGLGFKHGKMS